MGKVQSVEIGIDGILEGEKEKREEREREREREREGDWSTESCRARSSQNGVARSLMVDDPIE